LDPLAYRYLSQPGDERLDLSTAAWIMLYGDRIVGDGPASTLAIEPLTGLIPNARILKPVTLIPKPELSKPGIGRRSGTLEMNCFLCHTASPTMNSGSAPFVRAILGWLTPLPYSATGSFPSKMVSLALERGDLR
jgi:hypothetical protein